MQIQKKELIDWIATLDNPMILKSLKKIKNDSTFDFDREFSKGLTVEEFRAEMKKRIRNYPVRK
jgi:hypothetical protein